MAVSQPAVAKGRDEKRAPRRIAPAEPVVIASYSPVTGERIGESPVHTEEQVRAVVGRAREAQACWAALSVAERGQQLLRFRDALVEQAEELVELLTRETGKPSTEALAHEVALVIDWLTHFAKAAPEWLAERHVRSHFFLNTRSVVQYVPRGVVAVIGPWNFPLQLPLRDVVASLVCGNAAVVKPSEWTPMIMLKAKEIWDGTDLPEDLFGVVTGYGSTGAALVDSGVDFVAFTGSVKTGRRVAAACGERLIPCVMELGGKAPLIACSDADVERTAQAIVRGGFANSGQICVAVERVYAHTDIHDALVDRVVELTEKLRHGDPAQECVDIGGMAFPAQLEVVEQLVADALARGAELRCGGKRIAGYAYMYEPTVLVGCDHRHAVMTEEIFGPVVPFMRVSCADEAIRLANDSHLGLNAYVFTDEPERGRQLAERIEAGNVMINEVLVNAAMAETPFGGVKQSGFGRVLGADGLRALCHTRHITLERFRLPRKHPFGFPYTDRRYRWLLRTVRALYRGGSPLERLRRLF